MTLRIGFLTHDFPDEATPDRGMGGISRYTQTVAEALAEAGEDVHVFTLGPVRRIARRSWRGVTVWDLPKWHGRRAMGPERALRFTWRHGNNALLLDRFVFAEGVSAAVRAGGVFDVIESADLGAIGGLIEAGRHTRRRVVRLHSPHGFKASLENDDYRWTPMDEAERTTALAADAVSAPTRQAVEAITDFWQTDLERVAVVPNPLSDAEWSGPEAADRPDARAGAGVESGIPRVVFFGHATHLKGIDLVADAVARLAASERRLALTVIGPDAVVGASRTGHERLRQRLTGLEDKVDLHLPGMLRGAALRAAVQEAEVCVVPSRRETFGLVFAESLAWGLPTVASDIPAFRELGCDGVDCLLFRSGDADALASAIARILDEPGLAETLSRAGIAAARRWSVAAVLPGLRAVWSGGAVESMALKAADVDPSEEVLSASHE